jgi:hypothetical protein
MVCRNVSDPVAAQALQRRQDEDAEEDRAEDAERARLEALEEQQRQEQEANLQVRGVIWCTLM